MRAARMHAYEQWLILEDVGVPDIATDGVLIKGTAATMRFHQARNLVPREWLENVNGKNRYDTFGSIQPQNST